MGYTRGGGLPAGMTFFGRSWSEPVLIRLAYAYEHATRHRRPPESAPPSGRDGYFAAGAAEISWMSIVTETSSDTTTRRRRAPGSS